MENNSFKNRLKNTFNRERFTRFLDKQGFYIVLFLCLCIIGATAILTSDGKFGLRGGPDNPEKIIGDVPVKSSPDDLIDIVITDINEGEDDQQSTDIDNPGDEQVGAEQNPIDQSQAQDLDTNELSTDTANPAAPASAGATITESPQTMGMPVTGDVIKGYAMDELVYSRTLKEWTTHTGMDIESPIGTEVRAALKGVVESVEEDALKGIVITLVHDGGLETIYMGLSTKDMVRVGQSVEKGQVISGIGRTASFEITDAPHVHFEVLLNEEFQDPMEYIER